MLKNRNKTQLQLLLLVLVFILPMLLSWLLFYYHEYIPFKTTNHGTLITPPLRVDQFWQMTSGQNQWQIILVPKNCCVQHCAENMYTLHQMLKILNKDHDRVALGVALNQHCSAQTVRYEFHAIKWILPNTTAYLNNLSDKIYLLDPNGNLFMSYPENTDPMNILEDLQYVLRASQIG